MVKKYDCIPHSIVVIDVCNQGKNLCSPCTSGYGSVAGCCEDGNGPSSHIIGTDIQCG